MKRSPSFSTATGVAVVIVILCCACLLALGGGLYVLYDLASEIASNPSLPIDLRPETPAPPVTVTRPPIEIVPTDTLTALENTVVPENDPLALACRLERKCNLPSTLPPPAAPRQVGETHAFWVMNLDTNENFQVQATLRYVTPHVYFWVEDGVRYDEDELRDLAEAFEKEIYPTNRAFFGSEWTPGVDGDEHIYILYARGLGFSVGGYFSTADEYHPLAHEYSNAHEMFLFNADNTDLGDEFTYGVLAHEFQHMIHWYQDRNEASWINEGFSELAAFLNGYNPGGFDWLYISRPDLQLNDWPTDHNASPPHYGAAFLFLTYFLDRFGEQATMALVRDPADGFDGVDSVLRQIGATDPLTGRPISADDLFMDWAVTNYLQDVAVADGRYTYHNYPDAPQARASAVMRECPLAPAGRSVHQYGVDYVEIVCRGDFTLRFEGSTVARLLPTDTYSGSYAFWSNKGDVSDMTLTREFDFSAIPGPVRLTYLTWYDIEEDYDYIYLEVSEDGSTWQILTTPSGTAEDPSGNSYGWGYNGASGGWIEETIDLSQYAGKKVQIRFEYVTDAAVNGEGFMLDDVSIPEIGYFTDFESDDGGWQAEGFVRIQNALPQTFRLALILKGDETTAQMIPVSADQRAEIPLSLGGDVKQAILVVSGTTRFTRDLAEYSIEIR